MIFPLRSNHKLISKYTRSSSYLLSLILCHFAILVAIDILATPLFSQWPYFECLNKLFKNKVNGLPNPFGISFRKHPISTKLKNRPESFMSVQMKHPSPCVFPNQSHWASKTPQPNRECLNSFLPKLQKQWMITIIKLLTVVKCRIVLHPINFSVPRLGMIRKVFMVQNRLTDLVQLKQ